MLHLFMKILLLVLISFYVFKYEKDSTTMVFNKIFDAVRVQILMKISTSDVELIILLNATCNVWNDFDDTKINRTIPIYINFIHSVRFKTILVDFIQIWLEIDDGIPTFESHLLNKLFFTYTIAIIIADLQSKHEIEYAANYIDRHVKLNFLRQQHHVYLRQYLKTINLSWDLILGIRKAMYHFNEFNTITAVVNLFPSTIQTLDLMEALYNAKHCNKSIPIAEKLLIVLKLAQPEIILKVHRVININLYKYGLVNYTTTSYTIITCLRHLKLFSTNKY